jgi:hypothetical protein
MAEDGTERMIHHWLIHRLPAPLAAVNIFPLGIPQRPV